ncbi:hypothetical protein J8M14_08080 [Aquimarina sp. MMG016]|nr:hypothetical protein [Aquimarina sp. MMG016]
MSPKDRASYFDIVEALYGLTPSESSNYLKRLQNQNLPNFDNYAIGGYRFWEKTNSGNSWQQKVAWSDNTYVGDKYFIFNKYYKDVDNDKFGQLDDYVYFLNIKAGGFGHGGPEAGLSGSDEEIEIYDSYGKAYTYRNVYKYYVYDGVKWVNRNFGYDCDDTNPNIPSGLEIYYIDYDGDGYGGNDDPVVHLTGCPPGGGDDFMKGVHVPVNGDCNRFHPEVTTSPINWYKDVDKDGYGNLNDFINSCERPIGYVSNSNDCNDDNPSVNTVPITWYADQDNDGFGDPNTILESCYQPAGYITDCYFDDCPTEAGTRDNGCPTVAYNFDNDNQNYSYERVYLGGYKIDQLDNIPTDKVIEQITYSDGATRIKQNVAIGVTPSGKDVITHYEYDGNGESTKSYLPYIAITNGAFDINSKANTLNFYNTPKYNNTTNPYSEVITESSPLNRVMESGAPGEAWKINPAAETGHTIKSEYKFNQNTDYVRHFYASLVNEKPQLVDKGLYAVNSLYKTIVKNENWKPNQQYSNDNTTEEYKDSDGRPVLERTFDKGKWHDTYYVYDAIGNLVFVLPPKLNTYKLLEQQPWMGKSYSYQNVESLFADGYLDGDIEIYVYTYFYNKPYLGVEIYAYDGQSPSILDDGELLNLEFDPPLPDVYLGEVIIGNYDSGQEDVGAIAHIRNNALSFDTKSIRAEYIEAEFIVDLSQYQTNLPTITEQQLDQLAYQYKYDYRNRLVERKVPGKGWEYIVYNKLDQPVMTQDANQRAKNEWLFTKYDALGRIAYTGLHIHPGTISRTTMQGYADNRYTQWVNKTNDPTQLAGTEIYYTNDAVPTGISKIYTINYYDNYTFDHNATKPGTTYGQEVNNHTKGLSTGSKVRILGTNNWVTSVIYYDQKTRPIYVHSTNEYLQSIDVSEIKYDFNSLVLETKSIHNKGANLPISVVDYYNYDNVGRLITQKQSVNGQQQELIFKNHYDELGQLVKKDVGNTEGNPLQSIDYTYNIRGWLKNINDPSNINDDLFSLGINYENPQGPSTSTYYNNPLYNGNISHIHWKTNNESNTLREYTYRYDALNRLEKANFADSRVFNNKYSSSAKYDRNGNIENLNRNGLNPANQNYIVSFDLLSYNYNGNQLQSVTDNRTGALGAEGFNDINKVGHDYSYDANGNQIKDLNKGVGWITFNHLNLPKQIQFNDNSHIIYGYSANGAKIKKNIVNGTTGEQQSVEYAGNFVYNNGQLNFFYHPEGYVEPENDGSFSYTYQYKDHLGNIRMSYEDTNNDGKISTPTTLVFNDGFESQSGWESLGDSGGGSVDEYDSVIKHSGNYSARVYNPTGNNKYVYNNNWIDINNSADTDYIFSAWVYSDKPTIRLELTKRVNNDTHHLIQFNDITSKTLNKWVYIEKRVTVSAHIEQINLKIESLSAVGNVWFDDIAIRKVEAVVLPEIKEEKNYYPFGLQHKGYNDLISGVPNNYGFNGTELTTDLDLNLYEMPFRQYDPAIARWTGIDPVTHYSMSPYNAFDNNPIYFSDPSGADGQGCCDNYFDVPSDQVEDLGELILTGRRNVNYGMQSDFVGDLDYYNELYDFEGDYDQVFSKYIQRYGNSYVPVALRNDLNSIDATGFKENYDAGWKNWDPNGLGNFLMNTTATAIGSTLALPLSSAAGPGVSVSLNLSKIGSTSYSIYKSIVGSKAAVQIPSNQAITIYRGVNSSAGKAYTNALNGIVKSRGGIFGHSNTLLHNTGLNGTINSKFTSWTTDIDVALNYAYRTNGNGVLLKLDIPKSMLFKSPDLKTINLFHKPGTMVSESEWLLKGAYRNIDFNIVKF